MTRDGFWTAICALLLLLAITAVMAVPTNRDVRPRLAVAEYNLKE